MPPEKCFYCPLPATLRCPDCLLVSSCSAEHLSTFHRSSKGRCQPFRIVRSEEKGLHMVAARDIKPMEVILEEMPAAMGPYSRTRPQCLQCYRLMKVENSYRCGTCNFPMCGKECENGELHKIECKVFDKVGFRAKVKDFEGSSKEYCAITAMRILLLKESSPLLWASLQQLSDDTDHCSEERERQMEDVVNFVTTICHLKNFSSADIRRVVGIMGINNANLNLSEDSRGTGLYVTFARINHSCICNTKSIKFHDQRLEVRASIPIRKGEEICNQYVKPQSSTSVRRPLLRSKWHFDCHCRRCRDPTELGSNLGALLCTKCKYSAVLPSDPLQYDSAWSCTDCGAVYSVKYVRALLAEMAASLAGMGEEEEDLVEHYESFLHTYSDRVHPCHMAFVEAQTHLAHLYGNVRPYLLESLPRPLVSRKMQVCRNVLETVGKVDPGYSNWRGKLLLELTRAKVFMAKKDFAGGEIGEKELQVVLREERFLGLYLAYYHSIFFSGQS